MIDKSKPLGISSKVKFKVDPKSKLYSVLNLLDGINTFYIAICLPLQLGFALNLREGLAYIEFLSWVLSCVRIISVFRTPIITKGV